MITSFLRFAFYSLLMAIFSFSNSYAGKGKDGSVPKLEKPTQSNLGENLRVLINFIQDSATEEQLASIRESLNVSQIDGTMLESRLDTIIALNTKCFDKHNCLAAVERIYDDLIEN